MPVIEKFCADKKVIVAGSTWRDDEKLLAHWMKEQSTTYKDVRLIIAPHEIDEESLRELELIFSHSKSIRYSVAEEATFQNFDVLLIDNIGMLASLYNYATIAYIGGGFGKGIHNILEAAVFGKPVLFGPNFHKFEEANELIGKGGATSITNYKQLISLADMLLLDEKKYREQCEISRTFVQDKCGAVERIVKRIR